MRDSKPESISMGEAPATTSSDNFGSEVLNKMVKRLRSTPDQRRCYEYVLWLAKKLPPLPKEAFTEEIKVKGCISQVYVLGEIIEGKIQWKGYSDALITKGLLAFLIDLFKPIFGSISKIKVKLGVKLSLINLSSLLIRFISTFFP